MDDRACRASSTRARRWCARAWTGALARRLRRRRRGRGVTRCGSGLAPAGARTGEIGLGRIVDLANVDSAVAIQTADRVRVLVEGQVELLGRLPGATARGCSIAIDEMLGNDHAWIRAAHARARRRRDRAEGWPIATRSSGREARAELARVERLLARGGGARAHRAPRDRSSRPMSSRLSRLPRGRRRAATWSSPPTCDRRAALPRGRRGHLARRHRAPPAATLSSLMLVREAKPRMRSSPPREARSASPPDLPRPRRRAASSRLRRGGEPRRAGPPRARSCAATAPVSASRPSAPPRTSTGRRGARPRRRPFRSARLLAARRADRAGLRRALAFAEALQLLDAGARIPGPLDPATEGAIAMYRASIEAIGDHFNGAHHTVGFDPAPIAMPSSSARVVHVALAEAEAVEALLAPWADYVTTLGSEGEGPPVEAAARFRPRARRAARLDAAPPAGRARGSAPALTRPPPSPILRPRERPPRLDPPAQGDALVHEIFAQFRQDVEPPASAKPDAPVHYDLGVAYREMGLYSDAIDEFELAARDPSRACACHFLALECPRHVGRRRSLARIAPPRARRPDQDGDRRGGAALRAGQHQRADGGAIRN